MPSLLEKPLAFLKTKAVGDCKMIYTALILASEYFYICDQLKRKFLHYQSQ